MPSKVRLLPRTSGEEANLRFQKPALISAIGAAPISSSPGAKSRPRTGFTPTVEKKSEEMKRHRTSQASPPPERLNLLRRAKAIEENRQCLFASRENWDRRWSQIRSWVC